MNKETKKVVIIGDGAVGSTYAYTLVTSDIADEIGIFDINKDKANADSLDLLHSLPYSAVTNKKIYAADYADCKDADIVVITANAPAANFDKGFDRLLLLKKNVSMVKGITEEVMASGFDGIFLIASNPVDVMSQIVAEVSGLPKSRVIGTGTILETARLRTILAGHFQIDPKNIHGYVLGEHGASSFTSWSTTTIASLPLMSWLDQKPVADLPSFDAMDEEVRQVGFEIFKGKGNTSFGIAGVLARITKAIFRNESRILPISAHLNGEYGEEGLYIGVPAVIDATGVRELITVPLSDEEMEKFKASAQLLRDHFNSIKDEL
ncbi:L-lactate dehydrogenase [Lactococcus termiticola]|uniref:L-lactate dehydrogenase n=1 Tax=Lactococcus termiticola TaxID=2169526 RepID=A0A2R5HIN0_9LACT|nr:L-lactate dehydrogenase [Lactococcus termiticola]GBG96200.1 L-lactate dehydrogenase [Lactococcus termiticola]